MHDIDRTTMEYDSEYEYEDEFEPESEYGYSNQQEYEPEYEYAFGNEGEYGSYETEYEYAFDEAEEMELAAELLSVSSEAELDQFLGKVFKRAARFARKIPYKRIAGRLIKYARPLIKKALPIAGGAIGTYFGGPLGATIGSTAASQLGAAFGLELEGLSPEDQEFEVSRRMVRLLGNAAKEAGKAPPTANPETIAKAAIMRAVKATAPGLLSKNLKRPTVPQFNNNKGQSGKWYRNKRGSIVLVGL